MSWFQCIAQALDAGCKTHERIQVVGEIHGRILQLLVSAINWPCWHSLYSSDNIYTEITAVNFLTHVFDRIKHVTGILVHHPITEQELWLHFKRSVQLSPLKSSSTFSALLLSCPIFSAFLPLTWPLTCIVALFGSHLSLHRFLIGTILLKLRVKRFFPFPKPQPTRLWLHAKSIPKLICLHLTSLWVPCPSALWFCFAFGSTELQRFYSSFIDLLHPHSVCSGHCLVPVAEDVIW